MSKPARAPAVAMFIVGLLYFGTFVRYGINLHDEGTLLYQIERVADGQVPYTDFHIGYTPAVYRAHAAVMHWFGVDVVPGRWLLAIVNSLTLAVITRLALLVLPAAASWIPAAIYMVSIPVHRGEFAAFNVPYPVWYNTLLFVVSVLALMRFGESGRLRWIVAAGATAGLNFAFKPNAGLLNVAALGIAVLAICPAARSQVSVRLRRCETAWWWCFASAVFVGVIGVFSGGAGPREYQLFVAPAVIALLIGGWRSLVCDQAPGRPSVIAASALLCTTFAIVNLPWMASVLARLGAQRFAVDVLFLGAGFENFYYLAYPPTAPLALLLLGGAVAAYVAPPRLRRVGIAPDLLVALAPLPAIVALVYLGTHATMPDGFIAAVASEAERFALAVTPCGHALVLLLCASVVGSPQRDRLATLHLTVLSIAAIFMYMQLYPRTDYMHWVTAAPLSFVVGGAVTQRIAMRWAEGVSRVRQAIVGAVFALPFVGYVALRAVGAFSGLYVFVDGGLTPVPQVTLDNARAAVHVNAGRSPRYRDLARVADFVAKNTAPGEEVFTFPALDVVSFLADRHNPTRHGYFYPRWPGHDWEAEVVADLMSKRPRLAVVLWGHAPFFVEAPVYYYALTSYLDDEYRLLTTIGPYAVLARRDAATTRGESGTAREAAAKTDSGIAPSDVDAARRFVETGSAAELRAYEAVMLERGTPTLRKLLRHEDQAVRDAAVEALRHARDPETANALLSGVLAGRFSSRESLIAVRAVGNGADGRSLGQLLRLLRHPDPRIVDAAKTAMSYVGMHGTAATYWPGDSSGDSAAAMPTLPAQRALRKVLFATIGDPFADPRLRWTAIWATRALSDDEAARLLTEIAEDSDADGAVRAALQLAERGRANAAIAHRVATLLAYDDMYAPRALYSMVSADGARSGETDFTRKVSRVVREAVRSGSPVAVREASWVAAGLGNPQVESALKDNLGAADRELVKAAIWGAERANAKQRLPRLRELQLHGDYQIRAFADRAVAYLERSPAP